MRRTGPGQVSLLLFGLAFAIRSIPAPRVFPPGSDAVHPFGADALYHLRRVLYSLENFPASLDFDPYIRFPFGAAPIWTPVFDWTLALLALPVHRGASPEAVRSVETLVVWVPPLLGSLAVVVLYRALRRIFDDSVALVSGLWLALLPAHAWYSQVGFVDHHAAVALLFAVLLAAAIRWLAADGARSAAAVGLGLASAAILLVWPGALLHAAGVLGFAGIAACTAEDAGSARRQALGLALAGAIACAAVAPLGLSLHFGHWSVWSPAVLSRFQPWLFAAMTTTALGCALAWRHGFGDSLVARLASATGVAAAVLLMSVSLFPDLLAGALDASRWLFKDELFQSLVGESRPLFQGPEGFDRSVAEARLSRLLYLSPLAALALLLRRPGGATGRAVALLVWLFLVFGGVTLLQKRFFNSFAVVLAPVLGFGCVACWRWTRERLAGVPRAAAAIALVGLGVWAVVPLRASYQLPLRNVVEVLRGLPPSLPDGVRRSRSLERAAVWLRENTPPTAGFLDTRAWPEYGVLALWTHGHLIEYVGRRPSIANNFGDDLGETNFLASYRFFQAESAEARELADALAVGYVLMVTRAEPDPDSPVMQDRLSGDAAGPGPPDWLELVHDAPLDPGGGPDRDPRRIRIFRVRNALDRHGPGDG